MHHGIHYKKGLTALKKAHSSLGNVINMVEESGESKESILQQIHAVMGLLKSSVYHLLTEFVSDAFERIDFGKKKSKKAAASIVETVGSIIKLAQKK